ncbi:quinol:electron acceptor oxidoreductase subunit ActD [Salmonella enterica]
MDVRATDDKFVMAIELDETGSQFSRLTQLLRDNGASEVNQKEMTNN